MSAGRRDRAQPGRENDLLRRAQARRRARVLASGRRRPWSKPSHSWAPGDRPSGWRGERDAEPLVVEIIFGGGRVTRRRYRLVAAAAMVVPVATRWSNALYLPVRVGTPRLMQFADEMPGVPLQDRAARVRLSLGRRAHRDAVPVLWGHRTGSTPTHTRLRRFKRDRLRRPTLYPAELRARALESITYGTTEITASRFCQPNRVRNRRWRTIRTLQTCGRHVMPPQLLRGVDHRQLGGRIRQPLRTLHRRTVSQPRPVPPGATRTASARRDTNPYTRTSCAGRIPASA